MKLLGGENESCGRVSGCSDESESEVLRAWYGLYFDIGSSRANGRNAWKPSYDGFPMQDQCIGKPFGLVCAARH